MIGVREVMEILKCSRSYAYQLIAKLNKELEQKKYLIVRGRVPRKYFNERLGL